jgi:hypothetical protein
MITEEPILKWFIKLYYDYIMDACLQRYGR